MKWLPWLLSWILCACVQTSTKPEPSRDFTAGISITAKIQVNRDGEIKPVLPGESLYNGDRLEIFATVGQPAFVYVVQFFADGNSAIVFPETGDVQLDANRETRIPVSGQWFELDASRGRENIYLVAAAQPLKELRLTVSSRLRQIRASPSEEVVKRERRPAAGRGGRLKEVASDEKVQVPLDDPPGLEWSRAIRLVSDSGKLLHGNSAVSDVAIFCFTFEHLSKSKAR